MPKLPPVSDLARQLAENAEAVCRHYLSNGRRAGRYWVVGDVDNTPGQSLFVRLTGPTSGKGARGHWTDAATGEYGDLLDLIRLNRAHDDWAELIDEVREFLRLPQLEPREPEAPILPARDTGEAARRLFRAGSSLIGTPAATYLAMRGLVDTIHAGALRYHPRCYCRPDDKSPSQEHPALLAAVTDLTGAITGLSRTWLARDGRGKANLAAPRRALGHLTGHGVRFAGSAEGVLVAGEGIETVLSVHRSMPAIPAIAALSAHHLSALILPPGLQRLYIARDADEEGRRAYERLSERAEAAGIQAYELVPREDDFNTDLARFGHAEMALNLAPQITECDAVAYLSFEEEIRKVS